MGGILIRIFEGYYCLRLLVEMAGDCLQGGSANMWSNIFLHWI